MVFIYDGICLQNKRSSNMDSLLLKSRMIGNTPALLAVVCDGVGSMTDGSFASGAAVNTLGKWFDSRVDIERIGLKMRDAVLEINAAIIAKAVEKEIKTASTLSALLLLNDTYHIVHVGDSRIYAHDGVTLTPLTSDDVSETGKLCACIGRSEQITLQYAEGAAWKKTFLICTDGLYKRMDPLLLAANVRIDNHHMAKESVKILTQYVIAQGEQDNITIALLRIAD